MKENNSGRKIIKNNSKSWPSSLKTFFNEVILNLGWVCSRTEASLESIQIYTYL